MAGNGVEVEVAVGLVEGVGVTVDDCASTCDDIESNKSEHKATLPNVLMLNHLILPSLQPSCTRFYILIIGRHFIRAMGSRSICSKYYDNLDKARAGGKNP